MALLAADEVTVRFGGHTAVSEVSLAVDEGTLTGLIGPNGAGKTTLFNVITGLQPPSRGAVILDGVDVTSLPPHRRARLGLARTFQRLELFTSLTVRDNVRVAGEIANGWKPRRERVNASTETDRVLELVGLTEVAGIEVSEIPTGQARVVELARALMTRPRLLLLDEPASGQTDQETEVFGLLLRRLVDEGATIFLVEHDMALVMKVCDRTHVLDLGRVIASGTPAEIQRNPVVLEAYLGSEEPT